MSFVKEFKEFAMRGNVIDMAVGIVIGGAFGLIVTSFVSDILMPPLGMLLGDTDFTAYKVVLREAVVGANGEVIKEGTSINYGKFINTLINFIIIAFAIFLVIKGINSMKRKEEAKPAPVAEVPPEVKLLTEIRDELKRNKSL